MGESGTSLHAPAKLNLFLHVRGRRADGYHELQTLFRLLEFGDTVHLLPASRPGVVLDRPTPGVPPESDLALAAARLLASRAGREDLPGVRIRIDKRIPAGAGLGGGSSNAAAVLKGLNTYWGLGWPVGKLAALGREIGADVPVFVEGQDAWAEGTGERLEPLDLGRAWYVLVCPAIHESTSLAFSDPDLRRNAPRLEKPEDWKAGGLETANDFEPGFLRRNPEAVPIRDQMGRHGPVRLTGTGSAMFIEFPEKTRAMEVGRTLACRYNTLLTRSVA